MINNNMKINVLILGLFVIRNYFLSDYERRLSMSNIEIIGIDHGWSMVKTATQVFPTGVKEIANEPPMRNDILEYDGRFYSIGERRLEVRDGKTENENFYLLTLAAIAKELRKRGKQEANVYLAAGLPISRFSDEKKDFIDYLYKNKEISFRYEDDFFKVKLVHVAVFPQCYAAVVSKIIEFNQRVVIVDIGSWTIDIMPIENKRPVNGECISLQNGLIPCMRSLNEKCYRLYNTEIDESMIQHFMRYGNVDLDEEYSKLMAEELGHYADGVYNSLREYKINLKTSKIIFVGGGASVMKNFGKIQQKNISYILDVKANAKGFEYLGTVSLKNKK